ncbi:hypothetical protein [Nocardia aurea]|uniref:Beta-ketoacyl-[acyl-carrier-protein] synthase III N-terminal domain-containing protein n=1 Tax=Nocardia aurea TaxID=2144174 RepID=A0ABV3FXT9_9NOCA
MGITIVAAASTHADADSASYVDLAARVILRCLREAGTAVERIGMLVNTGVYREDNLLEPAVAALIQKRCGIGVSVPAEATTTLSFDLMDGAGGPLEAIGVAASFMAHGDIEYAVLVAGDVHPSTGRDVPGFPYRPCAAAILVARDGDAAGFGQLHTASVTADIEPFGYLPLAEAGARGRQTIVVREGDADILGRSVRAVRSCLDAEGLTVADFRDGHAVLLAPEPIPGFGARLRAELGLPSPEEASATAPGLYSAAPFAALAGPESPIGDGKAGTAVLLAADGASSRCLVYRHRAAAAHRLERI